MIRQPLSISVDFNRLDDDDVLWAPRDLAPEAREGQSAILHDADGNRCLGFVERLSDRRIYVSAMLSTWQDAEPVAVSFEGGEALDQALATTFVRRDNHTANPAGSPTVRLAK